MKPKDIASAGGEWGKFWIIIYSSIISHNTKFELFSNKALETATFRNKILRFFKKNDLSPLEFDCVFYFSASDNTRYLELNTFKLNWLEQTGPHSSTLSMPILLWTTPSFISISSAPQPPQLSSRSSSGDVPETVRVSFMVTLFFTVIAHGGHER